MALARMSWVLVSVAACSIRSATFLDVSDAAPDVRSPDVALPACNVGHTGQVSGRVLAPNGTLPLPGVAVYAATAPLTPLVAGPSCQPCAGALAGNPISVTHSASDGTYVLDGVPVGDAHLVVQTGKWRREVIVPGVTQCSQTALDLSLPRNRAEGDLPRIAIVASNDPIECVVRAFGVDDAEFSTDAGSGAVHLFAAPKGSAMVGGAAMSPDTALPARLGAYDLVALGCDSLPTAHSATSAQPYVDFTSAGGRLLVDHYQATWLQAAPELAALATFDTTSVPSISGPAVLSVANDSPEAIQLGRWLRATGASASTDRVTIIGPRSTARAVAPTTRALLGIEPALNPQFGVPGVQLLAATTPAGGAACGRVVFSDIHGSGGTPSNRTPFPGECTPTTLAQANLAILEYALIDVGTCVE